MCVCVCVRACVCVFSGVFLHNNSKRNRSGNMKFKYIVAYEYNYFATLKLFSIYFNPNCQGSITQIWYKLGS